jgi:hypothetical protein
MVRMGDTRGKLELYRGYIDATGSPAPAIPPEISPSFASKRRNGRVFPESAYKYPTHAGEDAVRRHEGKWVVMITVGQPTLDT